MKGLTIRPPWPFAIFNLGKDIENRDWFNDIRGTIAVQASKTVTRGDYGADIDWIQSCIGLDAANAIPDWKHSVRGAIVGTVEIIGCVRRYESPWFLGKFGFVLRNPIALAEPIPFTGQLGFWDVPIDIEAELIRQKAAPLPGLAYMIDP